MAISNSAPHEFDIARFVLDSEVVGISAYQPRLVDATKTGAPVFMVLQTQAGQLVNVEINNNAAYGYDVRGELVGELGSIFLNSPVHSHLSKALRSSRPYPAAWRSRFAEAYRLQDKAWIHAITSGTPSSTAAGAWDGYCATLIAGSGVRALETGTRVAIDMIKKPAVY